MIEIGSGNVLYLNLENKPRIYFSAENFYYVPDGISVNGKILSLLDEILIFLWNENQKVGEKRKRCDTVRFEPCPFESGKFLSIEEEFGISITINEPSQGNIMRLKLE